MQTEIDMSDMDSDMDNESSNDSDGASSSASIRHPSVSVSRNESIAPTLHSMQLTTTMDAWPHMSSILRAAFHSVTSSSNNSHDNSTHATTIQPSITIEDQQIHNQTTILLQPSPSNTNTIDTSAHPTHLAIQSLPKLTSQQSTRVQMRFRARLHDLEIKRTIRNHENLLRRQSLIEEKDHDYPISSDTVISTNENQEHETDIDSIPNLIDDVSAPEELAHPPSESSKIECQPILPVHDVAVHQPTTHQPTGTYAATPSPRSSSSVSDVLSDEGDNLHLMHLSDLFHLLHTSIDGLTIHQADRHTAVYGKHLLSLPIHPNLIWLFVRQLSVGFNSVLWVAALLSLLSWKPLGSLYGGQPQLVNLAVSIVLVVVILVSATFGFYQNLKSIQTVESFAKVESQNVDVKRRVPIPGSNGKFQSVWMTLDSSLLVPGDIVHLHAGMMVPADLRLIEAHSLQLNNSMLTGETEATHATTHPTHTISLQTTNVAWYSAHVLEGRGLGVVIHVGDETLLGKLQILTSVQNDPSAASLQIQLDHFVSMVLVCVIITGIVTIIGWSAWIRVSHADYMNPVSLVINLLSLIVAYVPQGLPICLTLTLSLCATRMIREHALVKNLGMIDTFDCVNILATDKTGTLTNNILEVISWHWGEQGQQKFQTTWKSQQNDTQAVGGEHSIELNQPTRKNQENPHQPLHLTVVAPVPDSNCLPNNSHPSTTSSSQPLLPYVLVRCASLSIGWSQTNAPEVHSSGAAVDQALYRFMNQHLNEATLIGINERFNMIRQVPFNSSLKMAISLHQVIRQPQGTMNPSVSTRSGSELILPSPTDIADESLDSHSLVICKGAPERVLVHCTSIMDDDGHQLPITNRHKHQILEQQRQLGKQGLRVIAFAQQWLNKVDIEEHSSASSTTSTAMGDARFQSLPSTDYSFLGLAAFLDLPKSEVPKSISDLHSAGIKVVMITGDHETTAETIGRMCGIITPQMTQAGCHTFHFKKGKQSAAIRSSGMSQDCDRSHSDRLLCSSNVNNASITSNYTIDIHENGQYLFTHILASNDPPTNLTSHNQQSGPINQLRQSRSSMMVAPLQSPSMRSPIPNILVDHLQVDDSTYCVISSDVLHWLDSSLWSYVCSHGCVIFARTSPEQKLRIVQEYQARKNIVLVTGDGVNDAPALRQADIGISMQTGAEVAREAADIIMLNDQFSSLVKAIETGRLMADNMKKVICVLLPGGTFGEMWPILFSVFLGMPVAINSFQSIFICVTTDVLNAVAVVYEEAEENLLKRPPMKRSNHNLVDWKLIWQAYGQLGIPCTVAAFISFFFRMNQLGIPPNAIIWAWSNWNDDYLIGERVWSLDELNSALSEGQSCYFVSLILMNFSSLLTVRTRHESIIQHNPFWGPKRNRMVPIAILGGVICLLMITDIDWLAQIFQSSSVPLINILPTVGFLLVSIVADELRRYFVRRWPNGTLSKIAW